MKIKPAALLIISEFRFQQVRYLTEKLPKIIFLNQNAYQQSITLDY